MLALACQVVPVLQLVLLNAGRSVQCSTMALSIRCPISDNAPEGGSSEARSKAVDVVRRREVGIQQPCADSTDAGIPVHACVLFSVG